MAFLLKVRWEIKPGMQNQFCQSEKALAEVMLDHPGVICYHADYPKPELSEWVEIYAMTTPSPPTSMTLPPASPSAS